MNKTVAILAGLLLLVALGYGGYAYLSSKKSTGPSATPPVASSSSTATSSPSTSASSSSSPSASSSPSTSTGANLISTADPITEFEANKKRYTTAISKAQGWNMWKPNAQFSGLFITLDPKLELNTANEVYVFDSPDDTQNHFTVSVSQVTGNALRAYVPIADYQGALKPIDRKFWQSSYVDAIQFALKNGGQTFANQNQVTSVDANMTRIDPSGFLTWVVTFHTKDATTFLTVKMDANTKTLVQ